MAISQSTPRKMEREATLPQNKLPIKGTIGLHSLAVLQKDSSKILGWLSDIPRSSQPRVFMDVGDNDQELMMAQLVENQFNRFGLPHEWHLYSGAHTEEYWKAHVEEYIRWYAEDWNKELSQ